MTQWALISDIHGNLAALEAVLEDIRRVGADEVWCLGDVVGYGPQPVECFRRVQESCSILLMGNHEQALLPGGGERFNQRARRAIDWTRAAFEAAPDGAQMLETIAALPRKTTREKFLFVHGSPHEPTEEYLMPKDVANHAKMGAQFRRVEWIAFCGHTHLPGVFEEGDAFVRPHEMLSNIYMLDFETKAVINVGSVGQPRDRNPDACYVTFDGDSVVYRRVSYDVEATRARIRAVKGLDDFLGDRLAEGR